MCRLAQSEHNGHLLKCSFMRFFRVIPLPKLLMPEVGHKRNVLFAVGILLLAMLLRISGALGDTLWVDEAESAINGLSIQEHGLPVGSYLGIPVYENTLTEPWESSEEYAYRDSSYSAQRNVVVYHGWLPLYAIAASQALLGVTPDRVEDGPLHEPRHGPEDIRLRTIAPRLPALIFSFFTCVILFYLLRHIAGRTAALAGLTWFGLSGKTVWFGTQSRYYPMTLLMVAAVAYTFFRAVKWGNWRSFVLLGIVEGLLFHTHQLSAVTFAVAALFGVPWIIRHENWFWKCAVAVSIAGGLTIPWAIWTGFFNTASQVPNVFYLFSSFYDWILYGFEHPKSLIIVLVKVVVVLLLLLFPKYLPQRCRDAFYAHRYYYLFLVYWMGVIYLAFHTLVPAASFFTDRLTLMLLVPFILFLGLLFGDIARVGVRRWQGLCAVLLSFSSIFVLHRPALFYGFGFDVQRLPITHVLEYLKQADFEEDARFYATPSNQLIFTYYSGMPVQSTVPVRKRFFDTYPGEIVILDTRSYPTFIDPELIETEAAASGLELSADEVYQTQWELWGRMVYEIDQSKHLPLPSSKPVLGAFQEALLPDAWAYTEQMEAETLREEMRYPIFEGVTAQDHDELWTIFFLRFVDYEKQIGDDLNYLERIRTGRVDYLSQSSLVIYRSDSPVGGGNLSN